jgi:hypothetical protein
MALLDITAKNVRAAVAECERLGEVDFLAKHGFNHARRFLLVYRHRYYPSKAIVGAAHEHATGAGLGPGEFSGGAGHSVRLLRKLGFEVVDRPADDWPFWSRIDADADALRQHVQPWLPWEQRGEADAMAWPGVYLIGVFPDGAPKRVWPLPKATVYVGQTRRTLGERLGEFDGSARAGTYGHSGGRTFHRRFGGELGTAYVSVVPVRLPPGEQAAAITVLEGLLIWAYARRWGEPPACNSK